MPDSSVPQECITIIAHKPNAKEKLFFFISGMVMSLPLSLFSEIITSNLLGANLSSFYTEIILAAIIAPVFEEFAKAYPLFYRHGETERSLFGLGFYTGIGFGIVEFFVYVFFFHAPVSARVLAFLFHGTNTSIFAYGIVKRVPWKFYLIAVILHFSYNFSLLLGFPWVFIGLASLATSFILAFILRFKTSEKLIDNYI